MRHINQSPLFFIIYTLVVLKTRDDFLKDVVKQLVKRRKELGITQEELNYKLGVADRLVSKWESGTRTPTSFQL